MQIHGEVTEPVTRAERIQFALLDRLDQLVQLLSERVYGVPETLQDVLNVDPDAKVVDINDQLISGAELVANHIEMGAIPSLESMTKVELMAYCKANGIEFKTAMSKDEILSIAREPR